MQFYTITLARASISPPKATPTMDGRATMQAMDGKAPPHLPEEEDTRKGPEKSQSFLLADADQPQGRRRHLVSGGGVCARAPDAGGRQDPVTLSRVLRGTNDKRGIPIYNVGLKEVQYPHSPHSCPPFTTPKSSVCWPEVTRMRVPHRDPRPTSHANELPLDHR